MAFTKIKLNCDLKSYKAGTILTVDFNTDFYWRRRLRDAEYDNCISIIKTDGTETKFVTKPANTDKIESDKSEKIQSKTILKLKK